MSLTKITKNVIANHIISPLSNFFSVNDTTGQMSSVVLDTVGTTNTSLPMFGCRAFVNFNGVNGNASGTYSRSGNIITILGITHGMIIGSLVNLSFTSGDLNGQTRNFTVSNILSSTSFAVIDNVSSGNASGNVTRNVFTRSRGNISSLVRDGIGNYTLTFTTPMPDINYVVVGIAQEGGNDLGSASHFVRMGIKGINTIQISTANDGQTSYTDVTRIDLAVFR